MAVLNLSVLPLSKKFTRTVHDAREADVCACRFRPKKDRILTVQERGGSMEKLKRIKKLDWFIIVVAIWLLSTLDYANLQTIDIVYLVSMAIWSVLLLVRVVFDLPHERGRGSSERK